MLLQRVLAFSRVLLCNSENRAVVLASHVSPAAFKYSSASLLEITEMYDGIFMTFTKL